MASRQSIFIGTPAMDRRVHVDYAESLLLSQIALKQANIGFAVQFTVQDSLVMQARNQILTQFLASDATDLIFIDSDIGWEAKSLLRLISHDVPIVAGVYRRKSASPSFTVQFADAHAVERNRKTGLVEAIRVGAGYLRIQRKAVEKMIAAHPGLRYSQPLPSGNMEERYALFDTSLVNGGFCGEDYTFCDRWRATGGKIWVDPDIVLRHVGTTTYTGSILDALVKN
ncbi:MAG: hypothetical protein QOF07_1332 [Bradyrhizobium sp.]|jgi:hypothetical protein|nr:hypothetical protein [Bradyrhizobium sp.]